MYRVVVGSLIGLALIGCLFQEIGPGGNAFQSSHSGPDSVACFIPKNETVTDSGVVRHVFSNPDSIVAISSSDSLLLIGTGPRAITVFGKEGVVHVTAHYRSSSKKVVFMLKHVDELLSSSSEL